MCSILEVTEKPCGSLPAFPSLPGSLPHPVFLYAFRNSELFQMVLDVSGMAQPPTYIK